MSKHEVLTGVSGIGKNDKRLTAGDVLDSALVSDDELEFFLARGAVGPATKTKPKPVAEVEGD